MIQISTNLMMALFLNLMKLEPSIIIQNIASVQKELTRLDFQNDFVLRQMASVELETII